MPGGASSLIVIASSLISAVAGISGGMVQRWFVHRDEESKDRRIRREKDTENVLLSDAAIISEIKPTLDRMRREVDIVNAPVRDGIATSTPWIPEANFYKTAQGLYYSTLTGHIQNEGLRVATQQVIDTLELFLKATHSLQLTKQFRETYNPKQFTAQVLQTQEERTRAIKDFVVQHNEFLKLVASTIGYHRLRMPVWNIGMIELEHHSSTENVEEGM